MSALEGVLAGGYLPLAIQFNHEYYRFITANFIHFGLGHLLMNMLSLSNIGPFIEKIFGKGRYIVLICGSALGTTILPYLYYLLFQSVSDPVSVTVSGGASGIILGLLGGLCFLSLRYRGIYQQIFRSVVPSLLLVAFMSIIVPSVSLSGHLGGFIGGFATAFIISQVKPHPLWQPKVFRQNNNFLN